MNNISWGRQFEMGVLGSAIVYNKTRYVSFLGAIEIAIRKQPNDWHPLNPPTVLGKELLCSVRAALYEELGPNCSLEMKESIVKNTGLYVALGSAADFWHHTDAVICCDLERAAPIVTVDLKFEDNSEEYELRDNHVVITKDHFSKIAANGKRRLDNIAGVVAEQLVEQLVNLGIISRGQVS